MLKRFIESFSQQIHLGQFCSSFVIFIPIPSTRKWVYLTKKYDKKSALVGVSANEGGKYWNLKMAVMLQTMERCGVCSEKNYVTPCNHCDKRVCHDCKEAHLDILRREIARVNNQVRRTLPRLTDALGIVEKNSLALQANCASILQEVEDISHRLTKAIQDRSEFIKGEIESFLSKEVRYMSNLRENLEQEIANFDSNSEFAEKQMGEGTSWDDNELLDTKDIFLRTTEFIRSFECETGDYHRRVRFFIPQDPNQLAATLSTLGELTINASQATSGGASGAPPPPTAPLPGLMRSKSDHRVAAQFRQQEERYLQTYGADAMAAAEETSSGQRRYFGDRSSTRFGAPGEGRRQGPGDYDDDMPSSDRRGGSRFRSRFMRNNDVDSDNEPSGRSVRFNDSDASSPAARKERVRVLDTEDATRGPLSGITRISDSPRVLKRLQEQKIKEKKKDRPSSLPLAPLALPTPNAMAKSPVARASRQVSEDEIDRIKKQNKNADHQASAASTESATAAAAAVAVTPVAATMAGGGAGAQRKTSTAVAPPASEPPKPVSRQTSTTAEKKEEPASSRPAYSRSVSQQSEASSASMRAPATAHLSRTPSNSSVNQDEASNGRISRVTDRFKPAHRSASSDSSTSAESSKHSSPARTGAAFSTDELRNRFGGSTPSRKTSPSGSDAGGSATTTATASSAPRTSRFGNVSSTTPSTGSSSTPSANRFGSANSGRESSSSNATSSASASASASQPASGSTPRFQSRFLGRASTPTAEVSKGSENSANGTNRSSSSSSSSESSDSSASESSDSDDDDPPAPPAAPPPVTNPVRDRELARTDIGPLLARSAQARDSSSSYSSRNDSPSSSSPSAMSSYRRSNPPTTAPPPPSSLSSSFSRPSRFGSTTNYSSSGTSDYSTPSSVGLSRSRTGSALHSSEDMESKYPLTSKYLNRSRANLSTEHSSPSSTSTSSDTSSSYTPRYGGYRSRFLNKSKSSAALAPDHEEEEDDDVGSESLSQEGNSDASAASAAVAPLVPSSEGVSSPKTPSPVLVVSSGEERYPSGRSRYAALKDRRSRLARSKSSHDVAPATQEHKANAGVGQAPTGEVADTGTSPQHKPTDQHSQQAEHESSFVENNQQPSSLSNWARYLKNKYGPRNKDATDSSDAESVPPRKRSLANQPWNTNSEDVSGKMEPMSPTTLANFSFSHYMQKRQVQLKWGSRGSEPGAFTWPRGVAVAPDNHVVVADSSNHRVQVFDAKGRFVKEFGHYGNAEAEFDCQAGVAVNRIGQYIVADRYNHRIQVFDPSGRFLRVFGSQGSSDGKFSYPWGVTTDALGFIYVCDKENHRIQVFQSDGTFVGKFGSLGNRPGQLEHPHYIAVSSTNRVIVSDSNNHRIQVFDVNGKVLSAFGQEGAEDGQFKFPRYLQSLDLLVGQIGMHVLPTSMFHQPLHDHFNQTASSELPSPTRASPCGIKLLMTSILRLCYYFFQGGGCRRPGLHHCRRLG